MNARSVRAAVLALIVAMAMTACARPERPLSVGVKDIPTNVVLGNSDQPAPPPRPPAANLTPDFPLPVQPPPYVPPVRDVPSAPDAPAPNEPEVTPPVPCPETNRDLEILHPATQDIVEPPLDATYPFRVEGSYTVTAGGKTVKAPLPALAMRTITRLPDSESGNAKYWNFKQTSPQGGSLTTTYFSVEYVNTADLAPGVPYVVQADLRGVYLTGVDVKRVDGSVDVFRPQRALLIMRLPAVAGDVGDSAGTDPLSQTTMSFHWRNAGRVEGTVQACGLPVGSFKVDLTDGRVVGNASTPGANPKVINFTASYYIATQNGGILVGDTMKSTGNDGLTTIEVATTSFINVVPKMK